MGDNETQLMVVFMVCITSITLVFIIMRGGR